MLRVLRNSCLLSPCVHVRDCKKSIITSILTLSLSSSLNLSCVDFSFEEQSDEQVFLSTLKRVFLQLLQETSSAKRFCVNYGLHIAPVKHVICRDG